MTRPSRAERQQRFLGALATGLSRTAAARAVGIGLSTVQRWRQEDPSFDAACLEAEEVAAEPVEQALYAAACRGEPWAVQMWLRHRQRDRWSETPTVRVETGPSDEDLQQLLQVLVTRTRELAEAGYPVPLPVPRETEEKEEPCPADDR
jgi:hypothetical protein